MNSQYSESSQCGENQSRAETDFTKKFYSILPDLATGWRPRNSKIAAPIFITYQELLIDGLFQYYCRNMSALIYVGSRYDNSYKFHAKTQHSYTLKYGVKYEQVPKKLQIELEKYSIQSIRRKSPFIGMNPKIISSNAKQLMFQANFQSANLDLVIKNTSKTHEYSYNLFLRPDTNTQGHMQWFYFKVSNARIGCQTVKFNICNNKRSATLYNRGMKPFIFSKNLEKNRGIKWKQAGENITYNKFQNKDAEQLFCQVSNKYYNLSFEYTFQSENDEVYFAYCPPFTYSDLKSMIFNFKRKNNQESSIITESPIGTSLSGLEIPVITITDDTVPEQNKKCVIAMGRIHPGQSNSSFVIKGFIEYISSPEAANLRKKTIFKVIPMINPDGVIFGNYRTSLAGKDLNRTLRANNDDLFPETKQLKDYIIKLKKESKAKIVYFLDFHGHSMKKNCFMYGPDYDIWSAKYEKSKVLPKILASKTVMFRYQSCLFRVAAGKRKTARAFMLNLVPFCYTVESSVGLYKAFQKGMNFEFDCDKWEELGYVIGQGVQESIDRLFDEQQTHKKNKQNKLFLSTKDKQLFKSKQDDLLSTDQSKDRSLQETQSLHRSTSSKSLSHHSQKKPLNSIKNLKTPFNIMNLEFPQITEVDGESDGFSQGKSDCESNDNDFDRAEYEKITGKIKRFIQNFNISILGLKKKQFRTKNKKKCTTPLSNMTNTHKNKYTPLKRKNQCEQMKMVPSLKYKLLKKDLSQRKIFAEDREESTFLHHAKMSLCKMG